MVVAMCGILQLSEQMMQDGNSPLTARSVLASALLGEDPPELPVAHLVHLAGLFGINDNRARVALSRMVAAGEVTTDGAGRYRLAGHLLDRQGRQAGSRTGPRPGPGSGAWRLVVVTTSGRSADDRWPPGGSAWPWPGWPSSARGCGCGPTTSTCVPDPAADPHVAVFTGARPTGDPAELAAGLWDLDGWAERAPATCVDRLDELPPDRAGRPGRRGSSCRPRCSATSRPTRSCPASCCPPTGPGGRSAARTTVGPAVPDGAAAMGPLDLTPASPPAPAGVVHLGTSGRSARRATRIAPTRRTEVR